MEEKQCKKKNTNKMILFGVFLFIVCIGVFWYVKNQGNGDFSQNSNGAANTTVTPEPTMAIKGTLNRDVTIHPLGSTSVVEVNSVFGNTEIEKEKIISITFKNSLKNCPENAWDASVEKNGLIKAWIVQTGAFYDLYIAADGKIGAPEDSSCLFYNFENCRRIEFGGCFDTSKVTNMSKMFFGCVNLNKVDAGRLDTSQVTDMSGMFSGCGGFQKWLYYM